MTCSRPSFHFPSLSPGVCSNSCPLSRWSHPTISSSVAPFSSCPQSFPASGSFPMIWIFKSGGQSIGASVSALVLPMNIQGWFLLGLTVLMSLLSKGLSRVLAPQFESFSSLVLSIFYGPMLTPINDYWKSHSFDYIDLCWQSDVSLNTLFRFVIVFLLNSKHLLISWLQSLSAVILEPKKIKSVIDSNFSPYICHGMMELDAMILVFWMLSFKPAFSLCSFSPQEAL